MPLSAVQNTFAGNPLDRASERRSDAAWIAGRLEEPGARVAALWNGSPLLDEGAEGPRLAYLDPALAGQLAEADGLLFLGLGPEGPVFALELDDGSDPAEGPLRGLGRFSDMRTAGALLPAGDGGIAATARAVFEWHRRHRFCSACGQPSRAADAGWRRVCPACRTEHFPRTDPVVIMLPTLGERCLLGRQAAWPDGRYSALAGFLEPGESIEEACARELREEAALETVSVVYHSSQPWPFPSSLMIGLFAEVANDQATPDQTELEAVRWFSRDEVPELLGGRVEGVRPPPPLAIAHQLLKSWAAG
jgi:NAD+ diphosphatase